MRKFYIISCILCGILSCHTISCSHSDQDNSKDIESELLVSVGDSSLYLSDVLNMIPRGINPEDSVAMLHSIIDAWVRDRVLANVAEQNIPDRSRIDKMVETYRNNLIIAEYLRIMGDQSAKPISEDRIKEYYANHKDELILEQPIVKGAFLKVTESESNLPQLRKWMEDFTEKSIDNIEDFGMGQALQYKYFHDEWHTWNDVAEKIPYRFFDADAFLRSTKNFETQQAGSVYLLHISQYIPSGSVMPYEFARNQIEELLKIDDFNNYRSSLIKDIYNSKIKEGVLRPGIYNPINGSMK